MAWRPEKTANGREESLGKKGRKKRTEERWRILYLGGKSVGAEGRLPQIK